jgi:hypothetical protein
MAKDPSSPTEPMDIDELLGSPKKRSYSAGMKEDIESKRDKTGRPLVPIGETPRPLGPQNEEFIDPTRQYPGTWGRKTEAPGAQFVAQAAPNFSNASAQFHGAPMPMSAAPGTLPVRPSFTGATMPQGPSGMPPMMFPTVPQVNPVVPFNRPTQPMSSPQMQPGMGAAPTGINPQQLLMILGGLGGPPRNPMSPGAGLSPQPGPPTQAAANILGGLTGGLGA